MRLSGISDKGFQRLAQVMEDQMSLPGVPESIEVLGVEKWVSSSSGALDSGPYDEVMGWPIEKLMGGEPVTPDHALNALDSGDVDDADDFDDDEELVNVSVEVPDETYESIVAEARERGVPGDTTYNAGWWGPDVAYIILAGELGEGEILVAANRGTGLASEGVIVKLDSYELPWYDLSLNVTIKTNKGNILLDSTDTEAYYFTVYEDETGTFEEGTDVSYQELEEKLPNVDQFFWR
jgi:hypothetical protein